MASESSFLSLPLPYGWDEGADKALSQRIVGTCSVVRNVHRSGCYWDCEEVVMIRGRRGGKERAGIPGGKETNSKD